MDPAVLVRTAVDRLHGTAMTPIQLAAFRAHAHRPTYRQKLEELQTLAASLDPRSSYVSWSAGKDSSVVAHACHAAHPGITILMTDPGIPVHWMEPERERWMAYARAAAWNLTIYLWDKYADQRDDETFDQYSHRVHSTMFGKVHDHAARHGLTTRIMGIRAEESRARTMLVARNGHAYTYKDGTHAILPIAKWRLDDVWAYTATNDLPWLDIYTAIGPHARSGLIGRSGERFGREEYLRQHFPEAWRKAKAMGVW
jgi:3'-phosphoadenosine 5'-phosphosulfate sulfotransferase (PAPS reductase)/FAD synthetase